MSSRQRMQGRGATNFVSDFAISAGEVEPEILGLKGSQVQILLARPLCCQPDTARRAPVRWETAGQGLFCVVNYEHEELSARR